MTVSRGEVGEGGEVIGVWRSKRGAAPAREPWEGRERVRWESGCDWVGIQREEVRVGIEEVRRSGLRPRTGALWRVGSGQTFADLGLTVGFDEEMPMLREGESEWHVGLAIGRELL